MSIHSLPPFRADHVGSFLRPQSLLDMRQRHQAGDVDDATLKAAEDEAIKEVVAMQEGLGLHSITDGEYRRHSFHTDFLNHLIGVEFRQVFEPGEEGSKASKAPFIAFVEDKIKLPEGGIEAANFRYLKSLTDRTPKATIPSPSMLHFRGGRKAISEEAYPALDQFFVDLALVYQQEIAHLADAGCNYLHMDDTNLAYLCDPNMRDDVRARGDDPDKLLPAYVALINASIVNRPKDMEAVIHLCRGNARSAWFAAGGYEPIAEELFSSLKVEGFFLEYDDERSGGFEPLRFMPRDKKVVLGLISSKLPELEKKDDIKRRIDEATKFVELDQICISPQCGFASIEEGNNISMDEQKAKIALVTEIAEEVWGSSAGL